MQLKPKRNLVAHREVPWSTWITSGLFSLSILAGYRVLEHRPFLPVVGILAFIHIATVVAKAPRFSWHLFLSQTVVVVATLASVILHTSYVVGQIPPGWASTFRSFVEASLTSPASYLHFSAFVIGFSAGLFLVLMIARIFNFLSEINTEVVLVAAYAMSAVNVALDYSLFRPFYHVSGEHDALTFFFTAGIFGIELSLPLHAILLVISILWHYLIRPRMSRP